MAALAGVSISQTTLPQFYMDQGITSQVNQRWIGDPPGVVHDPRFLAMPKINVSLPPSTPPNESDPVVAANVLMQYIQLRRAEPAPTLPPDNIPVVVSSLAHCLYQNEVHPEFPTCLHHPDDFIGRLNNPPLQLQWSTTVPPDVGSPRWNKFALLHPWMNLSRERLTGWTTTFVNRIIHLHQTQGIPLPTRYVLDSETQHFYCCDDDWPYMVLNCMADVRWSTEQVPGYPSGTTMADLFAEKSAEVGYDLLTGAPLNGNPPLPTLYPPFNPVFGMSGTDSIRNRPLHQFYADSLRIVKAAIIEESVRSVIRQAYAAIEAPEPIVFNYGEAVMDGEEQTFGWFEDKRPRIILTGGQPVHYFELFNYAAPWGIKTRTWRRNLVDTFNEGGKYGHTYIQSLGGGEYDALARWACGANHTWGDRDAVSLYTWRSGGSNSYHHRQRNLYKPGDPVETDVEMCERLNRCRIESTLETPRTSSQRPPFAFPFMATIDMVEPHSIPITDDFMLAHTAMVRAKDLTEWTWFTERPPIECPAPTCSTPRPSALPQWQAAKSVFERVYAFRVESFEWWPLSTWTYTLPPPRDLFFTLPTTGANPLPTMTHALSASTPQFVGHLYSTQLEVRFHKLLPAVCGDRLRIRVECRAAPVDGAVFDLQPIEGEVNLWDYTASGGGQWVPLIIGEVPYRATHYAITTPDGYTRRQFDVDDAARFIGPSGKVSVRLIHSAAAVEQGLRFTSSYDLVQVYFLRTTNCTVTGGGELEGDGECGGCLLAGGQPYGADLNADGAVDELDLILFAEALSLNASAADFDGDETVTGDDAVLFIEQLSGGSQ
ncbi:MAG: dockerin type I repeat-containing protein [Phycisphaerae bacterium]|nr:dockerin type I repeat-containing protein [Phycisphaerae bacterium]